MLHKRKEQNISNQDGYITLVLMVIIGALATAIIITALSDSISSSQSGVAFYQTYKARSYANACAEKALYRIHDGDITLHEDNTSSPFSFASGEWCTYSADVSGANITVHTVGVSKVAKVTGTVTGTVSAGNITIVSWN
jgi:hypothetical protein